MTLQKALRDPETESPTQQHTSHSSLSHQLGSEFKPSLNKFMNSYNQTGHPNESLSFIATAALSVVSQATSTPFSSAFIPLLCLYFTGAER